MVQLQKFYVGEDSLYLQLQHVAGQTLGNIPASPASLVRVSHVFRSFPAGGRLWGHLRKYQAQGTDSNVTQTQGPILSLSQDSVQGVSESQVRFWGAQLVLALDTLHQEGILCKDLNPRNILLGDKGEMVVRPGVLQQQ